MKPPRRRPVTVRLKIAGTWIRSIRTTRITLGQQLLVWSNLYVVRAIGFEGRCLYADITLDFSDLSR